MGISDANGSSMKGRDVLKKVAMGAAVALALVAGGCESTKNPYDPDKPLDKMNKEEWCNYYTFYLTNPNISAASRASANKQMHDRGCPGH